MFNHKKNYEILPDYILKEINIKHLRYIENISRNNNLSARDKVLLAQNYKESLYEAAVFNEMNFQIEMAEEVYRKRNNK
jgi:hypothetical protein